MLLENCTHLNVVCKRQHRPQAGRMRDKSTTESSLLISMLPLANSFRLDSYRAVRAAMVSLAAASAQVAGAITAASFVDNLSWMAVS